MRKEILLIATQDGMEQWARLLEEEIGFRVEVALGRRGALLALRREFGVVIVEEGLLEGDSEWANQVSEAAGVAAFLQINFAICGLPRLLREVRATLTRRQADEAMARRVVASEIENDLKSTVTGLLLESELALREPSIPAALEPKLRHMVELAGEIRQRLRGIPNRPT
jgi:hypothetical protein